MSHPSRRTFMLAAGAGSVALGSAALVTEVLSSPADTSSSSTSADDAAAGSGHLVAYVSDVASGEITVMRGDTETTVTDVALARSLARLAG